MNIRSTSKGPSHSLPSSFLSTTHATSRMHSGPVSMQRPDRELSGNNNSLFLGTMAAFCRLSTPPQLLLLLFLLSLSYELPPISKVALFRNFKVSNIVSQICLSQALLLVTLFDIIVDNDTLFLMVGPLFGVA